MRLENKLIFPFFLSDYRIVEGKKRYEQLNDAAYSALKYRDCAANFFFKVSKQKLQNKYTLQLLMYWRMGLHSIHPEYGNVKYLGVYNPRMNVVYRLDVNNIPADVISTVETEVIGY